MPWRNRFKRTRRADEVVGARHGRRVARWSLQSWQSHYGDDLLSEIVLFGRLIGRVVIIDVDGSWS